MFWMYIKLLAHLDFFEKGSFLLSKTFYRKQKPSCPIYYVKATCILVAKPHSGVGKRITVEQQPTNTTPRNEYASVCVWYSSSVKKMNHKSCSSWNNAH